MDEASLSEAKLAGSSPARVMLMPSLAAVVPHEAPGQCHDLFLELVILSFQSLTVVNVCQQFLLKNHKSLNPKLVPKTTSINPKMVSKTTPKPENGFLNHKPKPENGFQNTKLNPNLVPKSTNLNPKIVSKKTNLNPNLVSKSKKPKPEKTE